LDSGCLDIELLSGKYFTTKKMVISNMSEKTNVELCVVVPSFRRSADLVRCLRALMAQTRPANQILIVARHGDDETFEVAKNWNSRVPLEIVEVTLPGQVHALNAGIGRCVGDIVAITDDDAAPRPDWLARIEAHFEANPNVGAVGGRDWVHRDGQIETGDKKLVGRLQWFGRVVGNHHLGAGGVREVDILKGANFAARIVAIKPIGFDTRLRGDGAQVYNDMMVCISIKNIGWKVLYDPAVAVDHFPARRFDRDRRDQFDPVATADRAYNFRLILRTITPAWRRYAAFAWHLSVGTRDEPGVVNLLRLIARRDKNALTRYLATHTNMAGKI
jgi:cellulose synthase/poly-beta-1,6-N-acetylglucosamine synthase-like glycosyltransferase